MKSRFAKITCFILVFAFSASAQTDSIFFGGVWRTYLLHLPASYAGDTALPLVIALHGLGGSGGAFATTTGFSVKADAENFVVVYPNGTGSPASWNCGGSWSPTISNTSNDVGYISALIDTLSRRYAIDSTRVYATGFSNGSMMAYRLAAELSDKIAAIAAGSGPMTLRTANPSHPVAIIHFHALNDASIPDSGVTDPHAPVYFPPIDTLMAVWRRINGCATLGDTIYNSSGTVGIQWTAARASADVVLYRSITGGHAWPIGSLAETDIAWNFLKSHSRTHASGTAVHDALERPQTFSLDQNYPNPFNPTTVISYRLSVNGLVTLKVYDMLGRQVKALVNERQSAGNHSVAFDAERMPSGIYFYRLQAGMRSETKKLVLLK